SEERYKGAGAAERRKKIKAVTVVTPQLVRLTLHEPWPDFLTYYATPATGAGWIVPKSYIEKVGSEKFKEQPIGLGPYRFVDFRPGVEVLREANISYARHVPSRNLR